MAQRSQSAATTTIFGQSLPWADQGATIGFGHADNTDQPQTGQTIVLIGSSTIARCLDQTATTIGYSAQGFWSYALARLGNRLNTLAILGVSGETSDLTLARFSTAAAYRPTYILILTGMNDILNGATAASVQANLLSMCQYATASGSIPIVLTLNPLDSGTTTITTAQTAVLQNVNQWIKNILPLTRNIIVIDTYTVLNNGVNGNYVSTPVSFTVDGTHHTPAGAAAVGKLVWQTLAPLIPVADQFPMSANQPGLISLNPFLTGTAGTKGSGGDVVTGSVPDSWLCISNGGTLTATASVAARTDGVPGQLCTVAYTSGSNMRFGQSGIATGYAAGDTIEAIMEVDCLSDITLGGNGYKFEAVTAVSGSINYTAYAMLQYTTFPITVDNMRPYKCVFRTPPWVVPAGTNQVSVRFETQAPGTYIFGRACVRKVAS